MRIIHNLFENIRTFLQVFGQRPQTANRRTIEPNLSSLWLKIGMGIILLGIVLVSGYFSPLILLVCLIFLLISSLIVHALIGNSYSVQWETNPLFQLFPHSLCVLDVRGQILQVNPSFCQKLGYEATTLRYFPIAHLQVSSEKLPIQVLRAYQTQWWHRYGRIVDVEIDSLEIPLERVPLFVKEGITQDSPLFLYIIRDITQQQQSMRHLQQIKSQAVAANQAKSDFLATMSHEIRTPMSGVLGTVDLLAQTSLNDTQQHYLHMIQSAGHSLLTLINDILDFSKIEAGKMNLSMAPFKLSSLISELGAFFTPGIDHKGLNLNIRLDPELSHWVLEGDPQRLRQVLTNLLGNALKFTEKGSISLHLTLLEQREQHCVVHFEVLDSGIGISQAMGEKLFKPFTQADDSISRRYGGTGLGLAITRRLIQLMGGEIGLQSELNKGSCFWFNLPFKMVADSSQIIPNSTFIEEKPWVFYPPPQLLLAEDNLINQEVVKHLLKRLGCEVSVVNDGEEVLQYLPQQHCDLILMDCQMPRLDGLATTRQIRLLTDPKQRFLPIIALTASALPEDREACLKAGMDDYLSKPVTLQEMQTMLARYLKSHLPQNSPYLGQQETPMILQSSNLTELPVLSDEILSPKMLQQMRKEMKDGRLTWLIDLFIAELPNYLQELQQAQTHQDSEKIYLAAHKFKGACANLGATRITGLCKQLEILAKTEEIAKTAPLIQEQLPGEIDQLRVALEEQKRVILGV